MTASHNTYLYNSSIPTAEEALHDCVTGEIFLRPEEMQAVLDMVEIKRYQKGTLLLQEGQYAKECYYNVQGCIRQFYLKKGEEKTTFFYLEDQSVSSLNSTIADTPVDYYLECTEDTILAVMSHEKEEELYSRFPRFETLCRQGLERQIAMYHNMLTAYMTSSPEERYLNLLRDRPQLLDRVPQYQLASYLGVKPESLSRIRKRILTKKELRS